MGRSLLGVGCWVYVLYDSATKLGGDARCKVHHRGVPVLTDLSMFCSQRTGEAGDVDYFWCRTQQERWNNLGCGRPSLSQ